MRLISTGQQTCAAQLTSAPPPHATRDQQLIELQSSVICMQHRDKGEEAVTQIHLRSIGIGTFISALVMATSLSTATTSAPPVSPAPQAMCMATGEQTSGFNKLCYYDCLGSAHVVTQSSVSLCAQSVNAPFQRPQQTPRAPSPPSSGATTCFARGERQAGMNKICYYDCLGSARAVTQSSVSLCPLSIQQ